MRRTLIGILGLVGVAVGLLLGWFALAGESATFFGNSCFRVGIVLLCWWAAYDQLQKVGNAFPLWIGGGLAFLFVVLVAFPKTIYVVGPLIALLLAVGGFWWMAKAPFRKLQKKKARKKPRVVEGKVVSKASRTKRVERDERTPS